jgi:hypothetical protein
MGIDSIRSYLNMTGLTRLKVNSLSYFNLTKSTFILVFLYDDETFLFLYDDETFLSHHKIPNCRHKKKIVKTNLKSM